MSKEIELNSFRVDRFDWWTREDKRHYYPASRKVAIYDPRSTRTVQCCNCGCEVDPDSGHPSEELHTVAGYPMRVCLSCLLDEIERRNEEWAERHGW